MLLSEFKKLERINIDKSIKGQLIPFQRCHAHLGNNPFHQSIHFIDPIKNKQLNVCWRSDEFVTVELNNLNITNDMNPEKRERLFYGKDFSQNKLNEFLKAIH